MNFQTFKGLAVDTFTEWGNDKASGLAAALAYYTIISLPALVILIIALAGMILGEEAARGQVVQQLQSLFGQEGAKSIEEMISSASTLIAGLFALMFKYLPDAKIDWGDVVIGAFLTSILFNIGKLLIGLYLGNSKIGATYGATGSLVILLVWIYYSAQIFFLGAEFTQVYARRFGVRIEPEGYAEPATKEMREQ